MAQMAVLGDEGRGTILIKVENVDCGISNNLSLQLYIFTYKVTIVCSTTPQYFNFYNG